MRLKKIQFYIALMFALLLCLNACDSSVIGTTEYIYASVYTERGTGKRFNAATFDCHPRISDAYFSTLLQADEQWLCDNGESDSRKRAWTPQLTWFVG